MKAMVESMGGVSAVIADEAKMQAVVESLSVGHSMTLELVHKLREQVRGHVCGALGRLEGCLWIWAAGLRVEGRICWRGAWISWMRLSLTYTWAEGVSL